MAEKYNLPPEFILYVGTYLLHKNLETLLKAYHSLKQHNNLTHSIVIAGKKGKNSNVINQLIYDLGLSSDVKMIGFVSDDDLPYVYNLSDLFVFPSLYEGFGLPLLEAMACGVPVLTANTSCLPEIGGKAAIYFSAKDKNELAEKILNILNNDSIRRKMIERGLQRSKLFTWRSMAEKTLKVYEAAYQEICPKGSVS